MFWMRWLIPCFPIRLVLPLNFYRNDDFYLLSISIIYSMVVKISNQSSVLVTAFIYVVVVYRVELLGVLHLFQVVLHGLLADVFVRVGLPIPSQYLLVFYIDPRQLIT